MKKEFKLIIRELEKEDIEEYRKWTHPSREYHKFNGPYFKQSTEQEHEEYINSLKVKLEAGEKSVLFNKKIIAELNLKEIIGQVNWYWKSIETNWLEVGIVIFNENYWGYGIGYNALKIWIDEIFRENRFLVRIGLTTWSGNTRMMGLAEKLGMIKEAEYRKARIVDGRYYDSISYGILREEWENKNC